MGRNVVCALCVIFFLSQVSVALKQAAMNSAVSEKEVVTRLGPAWRWLVEA